jgi:hypothetical protein
MRAARPYFVDLDGDGNVDLVSVFETSEGPSGNYQRAPQKIRFYVQRGDGKGGFAADELSGEALLGDVLDYRFADFDGNGRPDVLARLRDGTYEVALQKPDGSFATAAKVDVSGCNLPRPGGLVTITQLADTDGDGKADLELHVVAADSSGATHADVSMRGTAAGLGAPACRVFPEKFGDAFGDEWYELRHAKRGDFDGDGKTDLVGFGRMRNFRYSLDIAGSPTNGKLNGDNHNNQSYAAVVGRFDSDDVDDAADLTDYAVRLYYGDRGTPFTRTETFEGLPGTAARLNTGHSAAGDFNGDGRTDFFFASQEIQPENGKRLAPTVCSTARGKHRRYQTKIPTSAKYLGFVAVVDIDADGRDEVVLRERTGEWGDPTTLLVLAKK